MSLRDLDSKSSRTGVVASVRLVGRLIVGVVTTAICVNCGSREVLAEAPEEPQQTLRARLISEYRASAARLQRSLANIHCRFSGSNVYTEPEEVTSTVFSGDFYAKGESRQEIRNYAVNDVRFSAQGEVTSISPDQTFRLRRPAQDASYSIERFDDTGNRERREKGATQAFFRVDSVLEAALRTFDLPVGALLERGIVETLRNVERDGEAYLEVSFRFQPPQYYKSCTLLLDPKMEYAVREYEYEDWPNPDGEYGTVHRRNGTIECQRTKEGYIVPKHVRQDGLSERATGERFRDVCEYDIEVVSLGDVDDSQFTLATFGLPEVTLRRGRRFYPFDRWYFWCLVATSIGGWLYLRRARKRSKPVAGSAG